MAKVISIKNHQAKEYSATRYSATSEYYYFIQGAEGKKLNGFDHMLCQMLSEFTSSNKVAYLDYDWLEGRMHCSKKTIYRMLGKLSNLFNVELIRGKRPINGRYEQNKLQITRVAEFDSIINRAISKLNSESGKLSSGQNCTQLSSKMIKQEDKPQDKSVLSSVEKCPELRTKVGSIYISNKKEIKINKNISSNKTCAREETWQEEKLHSGEDEVFPFEAKGENSSKCEREEAIKVEAIAITFEPEYTENDQRELIEQEEALVLEREEKMESNEASEKDKELEFNHELSKALNLKTFMLLLKNFSFAYHKEQNKLSISHSLPLSVLSDSEKETIRASAALVYGEGVKLAVQRSAEERTKLGTEYREGSKASPEKHKQEEWSQVLEFLSKSLGRSLVNCWFGKLIVIKGEDKKLKASGTDFIVSWIEKNYKEQLEEALKALGYACELSSNSGRVTYQLPEAPFVKYQPKEGDFTLAGIYRGLFKNGEENMKQLN